MAAPLKKINPLIRFWLLGFLLAGCASPRVEITRDVVYNRPMPKIEFEYELGCGDVIEIVYHYTPRPGSDQYRLAVGDVIRVEFAYHPEINRDLTITPTGNIALPQRGETRACGMTPARLRKKIENLYAHEFINPAVTVTILEYNRAIENLKVAITTMARGQSKLSLIRPDGYISFPMIPDTYAKGKPLPELKEIVQKEYSKQIENLTLTLILKEMNSNLVFIMGEVKTPGYYLMEHPYTVSQLTARAGGLTGAAEPCSVVVISRDKHRKPFGRIIDLERILATGDISLDMLINQYSVVYVPKTKIARANLFVDQYINRMIPGNLVGAYDLGGTLLNTRPVVNDGVGGSNLPPTWGDDD